MSQATTFPIGRGMEEEAVSVSLPVLLDSRLLIQGNSGAGKSHLMRLILEKISGKAQAIVLDPEGEFSTLRERFDFVLAGKGGEVPAHPSCAATLARKLMELRTSAIIDLYDLRLPEQREFIRLFLDELLALPKELYKQPLLVAIDEAHKFCPEKESGKAQSTDAVIALLSQGRKRGLCGALLTQRLSKLNKDAAAECNNVMVGRTWLDLDQERAGAALGMKRATQNVLRDLAPGAFYAFGPALAAAGHKGLLLFRSGDVLTTHPKVGERMGLKPPAPSAAIRAVAKELQDIPRQAEEDRAERASQDEVIARLRARVQALEDHVCADAAPAQPDVQVIPYPTQEAERLLACAKDLTTLAQALEGASMVAKSAAEHAAAVEPAVAALLDALPEQEPGFAIMRPDTMQLIGTTGPRGTSALERFAAPTRKPKPDDVIQRSVQTGKPYEEGFTAGMQNILDTVAMLERRGLQPERVMVARWLKLHPNGGRFLRSLAALRKAGMLSPEGFMLLPAGRGQAGPIKSGWPAMLSTLKEDGQRRIMAALDGAAGVTRQQLADKLGLHPNGGRFLRGLAWLRAMGVITSQGPISVTRAAYR